jgi:hypothetical protein
MRDAEENIAKAEAIAKAREHQIAASKVEIDAPVGVGLNDGSSLERGSSRRMDEVQSLAMGGDSSDDDLPPSDGASAIHRSPPSASETTETQSAPASLAGAQSSAASAASASASNDSVDDMY